MTRYLILAASVLIQTCIGGLYAWSEFVPALKHDYGLSAAQTQLIFGCLILVFTVSMVFAGRLLNRLGPRVVAGIGGVAFGVGYWIASRSGGDFPLMLLGIGVVAGVGTGFCYVCPLTMCAQWFPRRKGLATGLAVAGFGGGAVVLAYLGDALLSRGFDVLGVFEVVGVAYGLLILLAAATLRFPAGSGVRLPSVPLATLGRDRVFWGLALGIFAGTFAGLLVIGNLKPMIENRGVGGAVATAAISAFAVGNAAGRIGWGFAADRLGARAVPLSLAMLALAIASGCFLLGSQHGARPVSLIIGLGFGACFIVYAAQAAWHFGADRLGAVYPLIFLAYGLAGLLGPWCGGWIYDRTQSYDGGLLLSLGVLSVAVVGCVWLLRPAGSAHAAEAPSLGA